MKRTKAQIEAENTELRERVKLLEAVVQRLLAGPYPVPPQIVPMPYPVPAPATPAPFTWPSTNPPWVIPNYPIITCTADLPPGVSLTQECVTANFRGFSIQ